MDILPLLEKLQAIAKTGLEYAGNAYDQKRYSELLELTIQYYAQALETPAPKVREKLLSDLGVVTPKVGTDAAIFDHLPIGFSILCVGAQFIAPCKIKLTPDDFWGFEDVSGEKNQGDDSIYKGMMNHAPTGTW